MIPPLTPLTRFLRLEAHTGSREDSATDHEQRKSAKTPGMRDLVEVESVVDQLVVYSSSCAWSIAHRMMSTLQWREGCLGLPDCRTSAK